MASIKKFTSALHQAGNQFEPEMLLSKKTMLQELKSCNLKDSGEIINLYHTLLFICAHPSDAKERKLALDGIKYITSYIKKTKGLTKNIYINSGLPYTLSRSHFSHDFLQFLNKQKDIKITLDSFDEPLFDLNEVLKLTLPSAEKSETTAGWNNDELLQSLKIDKNKKLTFILNELSKLNKIPYIKDHLFDGLGIYVNIYPNNNSHSLDQNKFNPDQIYYHTEILKKFDHETLINTALPKEETLNSLRLTEYISIIKNSMALTDRETDPVTYLDPTTLKVVHLERGISVAIYSMTGDRQLPYELYVGYTLFKNGYPAAYGGAWVFGKRANFGINIFEWFRGGESGYIMCQLLRVYHQVFGINYFEVEPYQYGLDNPDGIKSGAFWYYYRYGFRPLDKKLRKLAETESIKIKTKKKYRTSSATLIKFTESNIALHLENKTPIAVPDITTKITSLISKNYKGNRIDAEKESILNFRNKSGFKETFEDSLETLLSEVALWCEAFAVSDKTQLQLMKEMISTKHNNIYKYQETVIRFNEYNNI